ncbi:hypothetical protein LSCM1_07764 [Leishmania martiniquensis]|uniref:Uncharacterized protein n=1 Tax=Leishmania martiniquensis TaxID=1580590 RepID=A0A836GS20_9TRYP|nr:hypothetical protein LSCM1_07764 [Leishmania martiniquensis]
MLSFRDIATTPDDADVLRSSLEELYRRRHAKQQQRQRREHNRLLDNDAEDWGAAQELAYRREVLNAWARQYPKLREAVVSLATGSSNAAAVSSASLKAPAAFSVAETVRPPYPPLWRIPAGTIPAEFYKRTATMDTSQPLPTSQRQQATPVAMIDFSARSCLVRVQWEALRVKVPCLTPSSSAPASCSTPSLQLSGSIGHAQPQPQHVLARWPKGKPASAKVAAVLRSIDIEERKREQWNEHLRQQQQQRQQDEEEAAHQRPRDPAHLSPPTVSMAPCGNRSRSAGSAMPGAKAVAVGESYSTAIAVNAGAADNVGRQVSAAAAAAASEKALGHELYWPARITRTRALFTGATCLQDTFHGLGELQRYDRFEPVLALALASPLRIVVDVVYAIDETSEALGLSIDPVIQVAETTHVGEGKNAAARRDCDRLRSATLGSGGDRSTGWCGSAAASDSTATSFELSSSVAEDECPALLPSSLPPVLSDLNYAFTAAPTAPGGGGSVGNGRSASQWTSLTVDSTTASATELRRSALSTSPLSLYTILAGPVSQTHSIVLLRPTPDVVCTARARALQELEQRWQRLRQALADRLVAHEEEAPTTAAVPSPPDLLAVQLPDADTYVSPFIDRSARQGERLPAKPPGAESLTEEEMQRQTRLPQLQGGRLQRRPPTYQVGVPHRVSGGRLRLSANSMWSPTANLDSRGAHDSKSLTRSQPSSTRRSLPSSGAQGARGWEAAALRWSPSTSPRTPRTDEGASITEAAMGLSAIALHRDTAMARTPPSVRFLSNSISLCSPASSDRLGAPRTDLSSSHLDGWRRSLLSESRRAAMEESHAISAAVRDAGERLRRMEAAACAQQRLVVGPRPHLPTLTVEAPSPASATASLLANEIDRVGSTAASGSARKPSPSPTPSLPRRGHHRDCPPVSAETVTQSSRAGDSPCHRTWRGMEPCSAILSVSGESVPDSQPMSALPREVGVTRSPWGMRNRISSTANQPSGAGDGEGLVTPLSGRRGATPLAHPPLPSCLDERKELHVPHLGPPVVANASPSISGDFSMSGTASPPSHSENGSQSLSSARHPIRQESQPALHPADAAHSGGSIGGLATRRSPTPSLALSSKPPLQLSRTSRSTSSSSDQAPLALTHTSRPEEEAFICCRKSDKALNALPARVDAGTEGHLAPQSKCATASASSSSSDDVPMLSGTAKYLSHAQANLLATAYKDRGAGKAAARESRDTVDSTLGAGTPSPSVLDNQRRLRLCQPELKQSVGMHGASVLVEAGPHLRPRSRGRNAPRATHHGSTRDLPHVSPLQIDVVAMGGTTAASNHRVVHGGSSTTSGREASGDSPLPRRPQLPAPSLTTGANQPALAAALHPSSAASESPKAVSSSQLKPQPSLMHATGASAEDPVRGTPRLPTRPQEAAGSGKRLGYASPEVPEAVATPVMDDDAQDAQQRQAHLVTANVFVEASVGAGQLEVDGHSLDGRTRSIQGSVQEAALGGICAIPSCAAHTGVRPFDWWVHTHLSPRDAEGGSAAFVSHSALSMTAAPTPVSQCPAQPRSRLRRCRRQRNRGIEESGAAYRMRNAGSAAGATAPPTAVSSAKSTSSLDTPTSSAFLPAALSRSASPVSQSSSRSVRRARSHQRSDPSQHSSQHHLSLVTSCSSPSSSARRRVVVVRRVVRRRRSEVFVKEGGTLVRRTPMPRSQLPHSSAE